MKRKKPKKRKDSRKGCCNDSKKHSYSSNLKHFGQQKQVRATKKSSHEKGYSDRGSTIKDRVWHLLERNSLLTARLLCKLLELTYKDYGSYVNNLKSKWKHSLEFERGSKPSSSHFWHGHCYTPTFLNRKEDPKVTEWAVECGWQQTRAKNRYLLWKDAKLGRLQWFMTGRININLRKPANKGKALQLLADSFYSNGLIHDLRHFEAMAKTLQFKGQHYVYDQKQRLPHIVIKDFQDSNGVVIRIGDRTHPTSVEIEIEMPDWGERAENAIERLNKTLENLGEMLKPKPKLKKEERMVV